MALDEPMENEQPIMVNGIEVLMEDEIKTYAEGSTLDYINTVYGEGFMISGDGSC